MFALALNTLATPADFKAIDGYGTPLASATGFGFSEIVLDSVTLASEATEPDGRKLLSFNATMHNPGEGYQDEVTFGLAAPTTDWPVELVTAFVEMPDLPPNSGVVATTSPVSLRVAAADAEAVKAAVLAKQHLSVGSLDLFQFTSAPVAVDAATDAALSSYDNNGNDSYTLHFPSSTSLVAALVPNQLLLENPGGYHLVRGVDGGDLFTQVVNCGGVKAPNETGKVILSHCLLITSVTPQGGGYLVTGTRKELREVIANALFVATQNDAYDAPIRDPYAVPAGRTTYTRAEIEDRSLKARELLSEKPRDGRLADLLGLFALHYSFNNIELVRGLNLDGEVLFQALNLRFQVRLRGLTPAKIGITMSSRLEATMRLAADLGVGNNDGNPDHKERKIVDAPLPPIDIPVGEFDIHIQPTLTVKVGAIVEATTRIVVPIQTSVEAGYYMEWDGDKLPGDQYTFQPIHSETPPHISDPTLAAAIGLNAQAWAEGRIQLTIDGALGPSITARTTASFGLHPFDNPWWEANADLSVVGAFAFKFFGFTIANPSAQFVNVPNIFHFDSGGPLIPRADRKISQSNDSTDPLANVSGDDIRWGRSVRWGVDGPASASVARVAGTGEDLFVAMHTPIDYSVLMRVTATGDLVWSKGHFFHPISLAATPDGGFVVVGESGGIFLNKFDGNGNLVWSSNCQLLDDQTTPQAQLIFTRKVLVRETSGGGHVIYVAGYRTSNSNTLDSDPFLVEFDSNGARQWAKHFASPDGEDVSDIIVLQNSDLLFCGTNHLSPDNMNPPGPGASGGAWLMRVTSDGNFIWARRSFGGLGMSWASAAEAPDGDIFVTGNLFNTVLYTQPSLQIGEYTANGTLQRMSTIAELAPYDASLFPNDADILGDLDNPTSFVPGGMIDYLPNAGLTLYDSGTKILWTPAGLFISGVTALGADRAQMDILLNDDFHAIWMTTHERLDGDDHPLDAVLTNHGIFTVGYSQTVNNFGFNNGGGSAKFLKLPLDGQIDFNRREPLRDEISATECLRLHERQ